MTTKVLMVAEQCNPEWASVPLVGFNFYDHISQLVDVILVTHERNREALEKIRGDREVHYIPENPLLKKYYRIAASLAEKGVVNWPLYHFLTYPLYADFNRKVHRQFKDAVRSGSYDLVHAITPMMPRYPVKLSQACVDTPFVLGPVNGGVPFPKGFEATAKKEKVHFNFLRAIGRLVIPGYRQTYERASLIFSGSTFTLNMVKDLFKLKPEKLQLLYENGLPAPFFLAARNRVPSAKVKLIFVGRLVPYKGADMLLDAIAQLPPDIKERVVLTVVGDGSERQALEQQAANLGLNDLVQFVGWVAHQETLAYYGQSDIFCFPSIREFGGAVVLEAMACGLPCVVVNNGGIGEYVTEQTGFRVDPLSRDFIIETFVNHIQRLVEDPQLLQRMSSNASEHARQFEWSRKASYVVREYQNLLQKGR